MTPAYLATRLRTPLIVAVIVIILDQLAKAWVLQTWPLPQTGEIELIRQWLSLTYIRNEGIAFGLFQGVPQLFTVTALLIVGGAIYTYLRHMPEHDRWLPFILGLIIGGAIGNVIDRLRFGYVVDFIKTLDGRFPIFNIADSSVVIGVCLMAMHMFLVDTGPQRQLAAPQEDGS